MKAFTNAAALNSPSASRSWRLWPQVSALLLVMVEMCWLIPWYRAVMRISYVASIARAALVLGGIMLACYALVVGMEHLRLLRNVQLAAVAVLLAGSVLLGEYLLLNQAAISAVDGLLTLAPGAVLTLFAIIWCWWRGISLGREAIRPMIAWRRFEVGLLLFIAYILILGRMGGEIPGLGWFVFFLFTGFLAVIFARVSYVGISRGAWKNPFDRRWLVSTVLILGVNIVLAAVLGSLLTGQYALLLEWLDEGLKLFIGAAVFVLSLPGLLLSYLLGPIMPWLRQFLSPRSQTLDELDPSNTLYPLPEVRIEEFVISPGAQAVIFWAIILTIVVLLFLRAQRGLGRTRRWDMDEPESLLKSGDARKLLNQALLDAVDGLADRLRPKQRRLAAARVRRIYAELLDLCNELGRPRSAGRTPLEFLPEMGEMFSAFGADLNMLTQAYLKVRYGELPETQAEVDDVEQAWQRLQEEGERLKRSGMGKLQTAEHIEVQRTGV